ncbi:Gag protein [Phytophthora cinnamomi]|uniref:Gag protein n=1 Tax=Phytophthora cinnamomi TaxID=4785 RepID=UPI003559988D|nr:Gag protein [Phytophthora cinnamomi]
MEQAAFVNLAPGQTVALKKLVSLLGPEGEAHLVSQGPDAINSRLEAFSHYENALLEHIQQRMSATAPAMVPSAPRGRVFRPKPLMLSVKTSSVGQAFPTWDELKRQISLVFSPPNHAYRVHSKFLVTRQGKKDLMDYVQALRTLIAGMFAEPLSESVTITVFMDGLRTGVARTEVFRSRPTSFEEVVAGALNAENNFKLARMGWSASQTIISVGPEPMDLSYAEAEETELRTTEQRRDIRRCFACGSTDHLRPSCPLRKLKYARSSRSTASDRMSGSSWENGDSQ